MSLLLTLANVSLHKDVDTAIELLSKAEEYFLPGLKRECESVLIAQYLTEDTATSLMQVAELYRTPALKVGS